MTSKTISVSEDAYELLSKMKLKNESFTETIKRLAKRRRLTDCAGLWSDATDIEMNEYWENVNELREKAREALEQDTVEDS